MTAWVSGLLLQVSLVLLAGLVLQQIVRRSAVVRHGVLLWTLVTAGLCPVALVAVRAAGVRPLVSVGSSVPLTNVASGQPFTSGVPVTAWHPPLTALWLALWAAGALVGMMRLAADWRTVRRLRRTAAPPSGEGLAVLAETLGRRLGRQVPRILISDRAGVPMALGCWRPVIVLPAPLLDSLDDRQLSQVLMHECAHAFRRDGLVGLCQRLLTAVLWFHPLIHVASRLLDRVREEICDNYALPLGGAKAYSRTLLAVAQSLSPLPDGGLAPSLCQPACRLQDRVAGLLDPKRCIMTKLTAQKSAALAIAFLGGALAFSCLAGVPPKDDFSHVVRVGKTYSQQGGDRITVDQVRGPNDKWTAGNTYEVQGTYTLASRDKAMLLAVVTFKQPDPQISDRVKPEQMMEVSKGEGRFTLRFHIWHDTDAPHISLYPLPSGDSFASVYF